MEVRDVGRYVCSLAEWRKHPYGRGVRVWVGPEWFALLYKARSGFTYKGTLRHFASCGEAAQRMDVSRVVWEGQLVKRKESKAGSGSLLHASPDLLKGHYPKLAEWMTAGAYEDGARRESPTLTIWAGGGQWRCTLKDRSEGLVMWLSAEKLLELLMMCEQFCQEDSGPWRIDDHGPNNGKRKRSLS